MWFYCLLLLRVTTSATPVVTNVGRANDLAWDYSPASTSLGAQSLKSDEYIRAPFPFILVTSGIPYLTISLTGSIEDWHTFYDLGNHTIWLDTLYSIQWKPLPPLFTLGFVTVHAQMEQNGEFYSASGYSSVYHCPAQDCLLHFSVDWDTDSTLTVSQNSPPHWKLKPLCEWNTDTLGAANPAAALYQWEQPIQPWYRQTGNKDGVLPPAYGLGFNITSVHPPAWGTEYSLECWRLYVWSTRPLYPYPEYKLLDSIRMNFDDEGVIVRYSGVIEVVILDPNGVEINWGYNDDVVLRTYHQILIRGNFVDPKNLAGHSNFTLTDCSFSNIVDSKGMFNVSVNGTTGYSSHTLKITPSTKVKVTPDNQRMNFSFTCSNTDICTPSNPCDRTNLLYTDYQFTPPPTEISTDLSIQWLPLDEWWCPYHSPCYTPSLTSIPPKDASVHYASPGRVISAALIPRVFIGNQQNQPYDCLVGFYLSEYEIHDPVTVYLGDFEVPFHKFICADSAMHGNSQTLKFNLTRNSTDSCVVDCIGTTGIHHFSVGIVYDKCTCVYNEHIHVELPKFHLIMGQNETTKIELEYSASTYQDYGIHNWGINATYSNYNFDIPYFPTTPFYLNIRPAVANITIAVDSGKNVTYLLNSTFYESRNFPLKKPITLGNGIWNATAPWVDGWTVYSVLDYRGPPTENNITYEFSGIFPQPWNYSAVGVDMQLVPLDETDVTIGNPPYTCVAPSEHGHRILRCSTPGDTLRQMVAGWLNNAMELPTAGKVMMARILFFMKNMLVEVHSTYRRPVSTNTFALSVHEWPQCEGCKNIALIVGGVGLFLLVFVCVLVRIARHPVKVEYEDE